MVQRAKLAASTTNLSPSAARGQPASQSTAPPRLSSSDQIVRDVVRGLYEGRFVAGQRLVEPDLMQLYAVSRGTIREALKRLAAEGVVNLTTFRGAQIRHPSRAEARDILELLEVTIGLAARLAARNLMTSGTREIFLTAYKTLASFADRRDSYDLVRARNQFYRAMTRASGNRELGPLITGFNVHLIRTHLRRPATERFADYDAISQAILASDEGRAEAAARRHIQRVIDALDDAPDSMFGSDTAAAAHHSDYEEDSHD